MEEDSSWTTVGARGIRCKLQKGKLSLGIKNLSIYLEGLSTTRAI